MGPAVRAAELPTRSGSPCSRFQATGCSDPTRRLFEGLHQFNLSALREAVDSGADVNTRDKLVNW